jgi:hypothetical protein
VHFSRFQPPLAHLIALRPLPPPIMSLKTVFFSDNLWKGKHPFGMPRVDFKLILSLKQRSALQRLEHLDNATQGAFVNGYARYARASRHALLIKFLLCSLPASDQTILQPGRLSDGWCSRCRRGSSRCIAFFDPVQTQKRCDISTHVGLASPQQLTCHRSTSRVTRHCPVIVPPPPALSCAAANN